MLRFLYWVYALRLWVVTVLGKTQITGSVLPFSHQLAEEALASITARDSSGRASHVRCSKSRAPTSQGRSMKLV